MTRTTLFSQIYWDVTMSRTTLFSQIYWDVTMSRTTLFSQVYWDVTMFLFMLNILKANGWYFSIINWYFYINVQIIASNNCHCFTSNCLQLALFARLIGRVELRLSEVIYNNINNNLISFLLFLGGGWMICHFSNI